VKIPNLNELSHETFEIVSIKCTQSKEVPKNANNRIRLLKENLRCDHINNEEKESIERLCSEYSDIFFLEGDTLSCTETIQHEIKTSGTNQPIFQRPYRPPYSQKKKRNFRPVRKSQIFLMHRNGVKIIDQPKNSYRTKRGLINLVGRVANVLFGVCDDTDAEYFYSKIRDLEVSNSSVSKSSDTQIQVMQSIISNVNSSLLEINKNEINLADKYSYLLREMQAEKTAIGILNFKTVLEERISFLNIILAQYAFETGNLLNIINMALQGFVTPVY